MTINRQAADGDQHATAQGLEEAAGTYVDPDEEWEALDAAAEEQEQIVLEEIAAARVEKAKIEAKGRARQEAAEKAAAEEAAKAEAAARAALPDEELSEEEVLLRRARIAARDGVQLRRTMKMGIFFAALGVVEAIFGFMGSNYLIAGVGVLLAIACAVYVIVNRPRVKAAVEHFNILNAELEECRVRNSKPSDAPSVDELIEEHERKKQKRREQRRG